MGENGSAGAVPRTLAPYEGEPCDLCAATQRAPVFDRGRGGVPLQTDICLSCGLVQVAHRPTEAELEHLYASGTFTQEARGHTQPDNSKQLASDRAALHRFHRLQALLGDRFVQRLRVLEVGCGLGSFLMLCKGMGHFVHGIEPDPEYAATGAQWYQVPIEPALLADAEAQGPFDLVTSFHSLEHMRSPRDALVRIRDLVDEGAILHIEVPDVSRPYGGDLERFFWAAHLTSFTAATLTGMLEQTGFRVLGSGHDGAFLHVTSAAAGMPTERHRPPVPYDVPDERLTALRRAQARHLRRRRAQEGPLRRATALLHAASWAAALGPGPFVHRATRRVTSAGRSMARRWAQAGRPHFTHFAFRAPSTNSGDTVLFAATRSMLSPLGPRPAWDIRNLRRRVTFADLQTINSSQAVVLGGGGLLLRDANPDSVSGWQWNMPIEFLDLLTPPLFVVGIGYNRFPGQPEFEPPFSEHLTRTVERSAFFGVRNHGSIEQVRRYLPPALHDRVRYQPCPTTVWQRHSPVPRKLPEHVFVRHGAIPSSGPVLSLNVCFDRQRSRYGDSLHEILNTLGDAMKSAYHAGWRLRLACHTPEDAKFAPWLLRRNVPFEEVHLYRRPAEDTVAHYAFCDLAIGMRGHSQMIPVGVGTPIRTLSSHAKMDYFLQDIQRPKWGTSIHSGDLAGWLENEIQAVACGADAERTALMEVQDRLWQICLENQQYMADAMAAAPRRGRRPSAVSVTRV